MSKSTTANLAAFTVSYTLAARAIADTIESAGFGCWGKWHTHKLGTVPYVNTEKDERSDIEPETWAILTDGSAVIWEHGDGEIDEPVFSVEMDDGDEGEPISELLTLENIKARIEAGKFYDGVSFEDVAALKHRESIELEQGVVIDRCGGKLHTLDRAAIERGLAFLAKNHPRVMAEIVTENGDANTGDCLIQAALFGELVYG